MILADRDKVDMEEELKVKVPERRGTKIICRSGSPMDLDDLRLSSHDTARSVILLAPDSDDPDSEVIKTLLALTHAGTEGPRIVAEIQDPSNLEAAALVGKGRTTLLDIRETVAKLVVQTSRQSGAAAVYTELFDYSGDEFYFFEDHGLAGSTYAEAQQAFEAASVVGIVDGATLEAEPAAGHRPHRRADPDRRGRGRLRARGPVPVDDRAALNRLGEQSARRGPAHPGAADRLERPGTDRAPRAGPLRTTRLHADRADRVRRSRRSVLREPCRHGGQGVHHQPRGARGARRRRPRPDHRALLRPRPRGPGGRLADARVAAPRARHPAQGGLGDPGGQRDDRRPQPDPRLGRRRRRHRGQRRDRRRSWSPSSPRTAGSRRSSRSCSVPRAARSTCGPPSGTSSRGPTSAGPPSWPARRVATRRAIGLKSALLAEPGLKFGVVVNPTKSQTYTIGPGDAVVVLAED